MIVEKDKTYITAGGYVVKLSYNLTAPPNMSPGQNDDYVPAGVSGWSWEKDGRILCLTPEWMEKLKIIEECPFDLPTPPYGYRWADGFPQVRIPKRGEYFLSYDSRTKKFGEVKCCDRDYVTPYSTDGRRLILVPVAQEVEVVKYYKHRGKFGDEIVFIKRINDKFECIRKGKGFKQTYASQIWSHTYDMYVRDGVWIEISEGDALKLLNANSVTSVPDVSSFKKVKGVAMKKETAINVVTGVAKFVGKWGWRTVNYWAFEPVTEVATKVMRAVRYVTLTGAIVGGVYAYNNPDKAADLIKSCLPKITVEAPEIMRG